ncbi:MAG: Nif3-like dinuclear metal center hexameric protein [Pirellulaceae bacterium]|nr:Nif3-like dinuclear metal center hexameric protein [Pirellulaceae bacterium]
MKLAQVHQHLESIAPEHLAEEWDNVGMILGDPTWDVQRGLLCIDLTAAVVTEAKAKRVGLVIAYHPPIFEPLRNLDGRKGWKQQILLLAARHRIAIYSPHTALDSAPGGVNDWLAKGMGEGEVTTIRPARRSSGTAQMKLVTFVTPDGARAVRMALAQKGAGQIGDYLECSFNVDGSGTFRGGDSTRPVVGVRGRLEHIRETRIEMVCRADQLGDVIAALRQVHPYEEPAFDVYPLEGLPPPGLERAGQGRVVMLRRPVTFGVLGGRVRKHLGVATLRAAAPSKMRRVHRIGLCAGAGGSLLNESGTIDAFVTGEMSHHSVLGAIQRDIAVLLAGHTETERPFLPVYRERLKRLCGRSVAWQISRADRAPLRLGP